MAATVEGAFLIIDRASPAIKNIRRNAIEADAAVKKLGLSLDELSSRKKLRGLQDLDRQIKTVGRTTEAENRRAANSFRDLDRHTTNFHNTIKRLRTGIRDVSSELWKLARPGGMILGMGTAFSVAAQAVGALAGGVVGLVPRLTDLTGVAAPAIAGFAGLGATAITAKLAFGGLSQAMSGNKQAMRTLTPEARQLITHLRQLRPMLREFRQSAQGGLFGGVNSALNRAGTVAPAVNRMLRQQSANLGGIVSNAAARLTQPGTIRDVESIVGQGGVMVRQAASGLLNLADALRHVAVAARPFTRWMSTMILGWTQHAAATAQVGRETGRLAAFFDRTKSSLILFGHIMRNLWETFRNLTRDARPLGEELWRAAERTTRGWARVTATIGSRTRLTQDFLMMGKAIRDIFNLVGELGGAIFRLGTGGGLDKTVNGLRQLVPSLERIANYMGNTFGPAMAQTLVSFANVLTDLTGATGPFTVLLKTLTMTFDLLHGIIGLAGPFKGVFASALSTALIIRYLAKLGLLELGWKRVAVAAGEAAVAESAASGGGGGFIRLGPVGRGIGGGIRGFGGGLRGGITGLFRRGGGGAAESTLEMRALGIGAQAGGASRLAGLAGLSRFFGVAGKVALPLALIGGALGGLTAGRSGGLGHQALQTGFGVVNSAAMGIPGHFFHGLETPSQQAARMIAGDQSSLTRDLSAADRGRSGIARLTAELAVLQSHANGIDDTRTQEARDYTTQLQQEMNARRQLIAQLFAEQRQRGTTQGQAERQSLNRIYNTTPGTVAHRLAVASQAGLAQLQRYPGRGPRAVATRTSIEQGILGAPGGGAYANRIVAAEAGMGRRIRIAGGAIMTANSVPGMERRMTNAGELYAERRSAALTPRQQMMSAALQAAGLSPGEAQRAVKRWEAHGNRGTVWDYVDAIPKIPIPHLAGGGRIPGSGLHDTMPVSGFAAPGELVVNRHTEARANAMLAAHGTSLGGLVGRESRRHSDTFATGGRANFGSHPAIGGRIAQIVGLLEGRFPGLSVTATTDGNHVNGSYHYKGQAVDMGGPPGLMNRAGAWIQKHLAGQLLEGIHNNTLSVKNGLPQSALFWGAKTWAGHLNHIHLAAAGAGIAPLAGGGGTAASTGAGTGTTAAGPPSIAAAFQRQRNAALLGVMGFGGMKFPGAAGGGGTATATGGGGGGGVALSTASSMAVRRGQQFILNYLGAHGWQNDQLQQAQRLMNYEDASGRPGDNNSSFGPRQLHAGGQLPANVWARGADYAQRWAWSKPGLTYAAKGIAGFGNLHGAALANAIATKQGSTNIAREAAALLSGGGGSVYDNAATGTRVKWGGWHASGLDRTYSTPTLIGVGEGGRPERVTVTPHGKGASFQATFHIYEANDAAMVRREVLAALDTFTQHLEHMPVDGTDMS